MFGGGFEGFDQGKAMEASFKEFLSRPENQALVEKHQRREVKQALQLQEKQRAVEFRDKVLESDYEAQKAIAPFLSNRVLRRVIQTFANDPNGDFSKWATNPRVIYMLQEAKKMMDEGYLRESDAEEHMLRQLRDPSNEHHSEFAAKTKQVARLPTDQLVQALNEHLTERRQGNAAYRAGNTSEALKFYTRAQAVIELVKGLSRADQAEVDINRISINLNIAAVHMTTKEYGHAVQFCDKALELDPYSKKALVRRAKANIGRHEYATAASDIERLEAVLTERGERGMPVYDREVVELKRLLVATQKADKKQEREVFSGMFER